MQKRCIALELAPYSWTPPKDVPKMPEMPYILRSVENDSHLPVFLHASKNIQQLYINVSTEIYAT